MRGTAPHWVPDRAQHSVGPPAFHAPPSCPLLLFSATAIAPAYGIAPVQATARYSNEAVLKWAQALTTQTGCILYLSCGVVCVVLNASGRISTGQLGLVLLYAAQLQRSGMGYMMGTCLSPFRLPQSLLPPDNPSPASTPPHPSSSLRCSVPPLPQTLSPL